MLAELSANIHYQRVSFPVEETIYYCKRKAQQFMSSVSRRNVISFRLSIPSPSLDIYIRKIEQ